MFYFKFAKGIKSKKTKFQLLKFNNNPYIRKSIL